MVERPESPGIRRDPVAGLFGNVPGSSPCPAAIFLCELSAVDADFRKHLSSRMACTHLPANPGFLVSAPQAGAKAHTHR